MSDAVRNQHLNAPECPFTIDFATEVLTEIRQSAFEAFRALPYGGLEIGGVLFGRVLPSGRSPQRVEVVAQQPIECDHAAGPAFILSSMDRAKLPQLFERARLHEDLAVLSVVGFWVSHGRSELGLTSHDADLYRSFFPLGWQIALMLKPENSRPMREALYCRVANKVVPYERPVREAAPEPQQSLTPPVPAEAALPEISFPGLTLAEPALPEVASPEAASSETTLAEPISQETTPPEAALPEPVLAAKPVVPELPKFPTDIYLPAPPTEPQPETGRSAKGQYRPSSRARALAQTFEVSEDLPVEPPPLPRPKNYWEEAEAHSPAVESAWPPPQTSSYFDRPSHGAEPTYSPEPVYAAAPEHPAPELVEEAVASSPVEPVFEPALETHAEEKVLPQVDPEPGDGNIPPSFDLREKQDAAVQPAVPPTGYILDPFQTLSHGSTASLGGLATAKRSVQPPPVPVAKPDPEPVQTAPGNFQADEDLRNLFALRRAVAAEFSDSATLEEDAGEFHRPRRQALPSFALPAVIAMMVVCMVVGGVLGFWFFGNHQPVAAQAPRAELGLEMFNTGKDVLIHWDARSPVVLNARAAELRVQDGGSVQTLLLDLNALGKGYFHYMPTSTDVQTTLIVTETDGRVEQSLSSHFAQ